MIPDKIYFNPKFDIPQREKECSDDIEYIRKDALLEWAKEELAHANANIKIRPYEESYQGHKEKLEELIEHIESL